MVERMNHCFQCSGRIGLCLKSEDGFFFKQMGWLDLVI